MIITGSEVDILKANAMESQTCLLSLCASETTALGSKSGRRSLTVLHLLDNNGERQAVLPGHDQAFDTNE